MASRCRYRSRLLSDAIASAVAAVGTLQVTDEPSSGAGAGARVKTPPLKTRSRSLSELPRPGSRERLNVVGYVDAFDPTPAASAANTDDEQSIGGATSTTDDSYVVPSSATAPRSVPYLLDDDDDNDDDDAYIEPDSSSDISIRSSSRSIPRIVLTASINE
jgi:hypothetical protein